MSTILAKKLEMTHIFDEKGRQVPVTLLLASGNFVTQIKTIEKDGYQAVQIGFGDKKNLKKPQQGHLKKVGKALGALREFKIDDPEGYETGREIDLSQFQVGDQINIQGVTKGKGFAGTIKRHNFHRGPKTHGSHNYRAPGSIGSMFPQHVFKGQKLPGRMGATKVTVKNLKIAQIIPEEGLILVEGAVPGPKKGMLLVTAKKNLKEKNND